MEDITTKHSELFDQTGVIMICLSRVFPATISQQIAQFGVSEDRYVLVGFSDKDAGNGIKKHMRSSMSSQRKNKNPLFDTISFTSIWGQFHFARWHFKDRSPKPILVMDYKSVDRINKPARHRQEINLRGMSHFAHNEDVCVACVMQVDDFDEEVPTIENLTIQGESVAGLENANVVFMVHRDGRDDFQAVTTVLKNKVNGVR